MAVGQEEWSAAAVAGGKEKSRLNGRGQRMVGRRVVSCRDGRG